MPLFFVNWSLSLGATSSSFMLLPLLKWTWMPYFLQVFFILSLNPSLYGTVICPLLMLLLLLFLLDLGVLILTFVLFIAQFGYLHKTRALCICCCSSSICCWLEQMCLALCKRVLMMLYLFAMAWWLPHCKYWLVWVGFLLHCGSQASITLWCYQSVQEGHRPISSGGLVSLANIYWRHQSVLICRRWLYSLIWTWNWVLCIRKITPQ